MISPSLAECVWRFSTRNNPRADCVMSCCLSKDTEYTHRLQSHTQYIGYIKLLMEHLCTLTSASLSARTGLFLSLESPWLLALAGKSNEFGLSKVLPTSKNTHQGSTWMRPLSTICSSRTAQWPTVEDSGCTGNHPDGNVCNRFRRHPFFDESVL